MRRLIVSGALLAAAALLAACSSAPGPLGPDPAGPSYQCVPGKIGHAVTIGEYDLHNTSKTLVTIVSITLPGVHRLTVTKPYLAPVYHDPKNGDWDLIGAGGPWPPTTQPTWPEHRLAVGAVIRPGQDMNLVYGLARTSGREGYTGAAIVTYTAGRWTYVLYESLDMMVSQNCFAEPSPWNA